ncbi:MAG: hypothetical protein OXH66_04285 [Gemmatimonadetes bacterium]|nr:hypothetical protein [Gemmatimonadota bacterium]
MVRTVVLAAIAAAAATAACTPTLPDAARIGDPVPGLTEEELARFDAGRALFDRVFSVDEGTGPLFNENQCSACHTFPEPGGTGEQLVIKATRRLPDGSCDILASEGGENLRRQATPALARLGIERDTIPSATADIATFAVPFLFGLGAADLVPERALHEAADPDDIDGDGISGRVGRTPDGRVGRFGRKADVASLDDFTHLALFNEMGITTTSHARERGPNGAPLPDGVDPAPDPELGDDRVDLITDFVRMLAPPPRRTPDPGDDPDATALIAHGEALFTAIGCAACHTPHVTTGPSPLAPLDRVRAPLYSDLLLHDLGPALASTCAPGATETEYRTAPLLGLGARRTYLHDLRAFSLERAIELHGGEARSARDAFAALPVADRQALLRFLRSL